ncbi:MAG: hypothetical protein AB7Q17_15620 [Phycisphaerae bacterium]
MRPTIRALATVVLLAGAAVADESKGGARGEDYELRVGERTISVALDQEFTIETPKGEKLKATLRAKPTRTYRTDGVAFQYPRDFTLRRERDGDMISLTIEATDSRIIMVHIHAAKMPAGPLVDATLESIAAEVATGTGAKQSPEPVACKRTFKGRAASGKKLEYAVLGQRITTEAYAFGEAGRTVLIMLQTDHEDAAAAEKPFALLADSFEITR